MNFYERTKAYDLAMATPVIAFYIYVLSRLGDDVADLFGQVVSGNTLVLTGLANTVLTIAFATLIVWLLLIRRVPKAKASGIYPRLAAVAGTTTTLAIGVIPLAELPVPVAILTMVPVLAGLLGAVIVLIWLGRQFSIMPEARSLVTSGPYAIVRHPLYLCEQIAFFGLALQHVQPWAFIIFLAQAALQFVRIIYEERVLTAAFPEYEAYSRRTARLIPGIY
jgi:protein-S-isoprenylcysteine O-methyltransferase Ste14